MESSAARHGKIRSIKDHIVPWFYNQRSDLVTRLRLEPVNLERIFFSSGSFRVKRGEENRGEKRNSQDRAN